MHDQEAGYTETHEYYKKLNVITQVTLYNQICDGRPFGSILYRTGRPSAFMSYNNSETTSFTFQEELAP